MHVTSKGSDQTELVWAFASHLYHIVGNLMLRLIFVLKMLSAYYVCCSLKANTMNSLVSSMIWDYNIYKMGFHSL